MSKIAIIIIPFERKNVAMGIDIGIIDADLLDHGTRHPNLALMKLSGYHKGIGDHVELIDAYHDIAQFDKLYISKVFSFTKIPIEFAENKKIVRGGTGFFPNGEGPSLEPQIEHHFPDYHLYDEFIKKQYAKGINGNHYSDYTDYSIGFTTRGCFRKCDYCVNKNSTKVIRHSKVDEFLDGGRPRIYLWDDNFLGFSGWEEVIDELEDTKKPFQFRQGLDIRLLNRKKAKRLSTTKYYGDFIFAFDNINDKEIIEEKLHLWREYCSKTTKLYVLCAYYSQDLLDVINLLERIKINMSFGCLSYVMRFEKYKESKFRGLYTEISRWCNQPKIFKKMSFREFCYANQNYLQDQNHICSALRTFISFDKEYPEISNKYFDLKFESQNLYALGR